MVWFGLRHPGKHEFADQVPPEDRYDGDIIFSSPIIGGGHVQIVPHQDIPESYLVRIRQRERHKKQPRRRFHLLPRRRHQAT